ncbi:MAG: hypothetical protein WC955_05250 [Elusimicrobiota bacterium]
MNKCITLIIASCILMVGKSEGAAIPVTVSPDIMLVFTSGTNGLMTSCNCPTQPYGGISPRAGIIRSMSKTTVPSLIMDSGDTISPYSNPQLNKYVLKCMQSIGYQAVNLGDVDFAMGVSYIQKQIDLNMIPFISANIKLSTGNATVFFAQEYVIRELPGLTVAITGITIKDSFKFHKHEKYAGLVFEDPVEAVTRVLNKVRADVDLVIVLSDAGSEYDRVFAKTVKGVDIIIGGHINERMERPEKIGETYIAHPGTRGEYVGMMMLYVDKKEKKIKDYLYNLLPLSKDLPTDPEVDEIIANFNKEIKDTTEKVLEREKGKSGGKSKTTGGGTKK